MKIAETNRFQVFPESQGDGSQNFKQVCNAKQIRSWSKCVESYDNY